MSKPTVTARALSITDAARYLDVTRKTVYSLIEAGELRRTTISGAKLVRIPVEDLDRLLGLSTDREAS